MDLAVAAAVLGADLGHARLTDTAVVLPRPGGDVVIPVNFRDSDVVGPVAALMDVPLYGRPRDWLTMYDVPRHRSSDRHVSVDPVWQACVTADRLATDEAAADRQVLEVLLALKRPDDAAAAHAAPPAGPARRRLIDATLADAADFVANLDADPDTRPLADDVRRARAALVLADTQARRLQDQLDRARADLRGRLGGRVVYFGGTATSLADQQPTALGSCPGVVLHGAVYNAIMTGALWRRAPDAVGLGLTAAAGLVTLGLVGTLPPGRASAAAAALGVGYLAVDGYVLFARAHLIVAAAGPAVAVGLVWAGTTLTNYLAEVAERSRITRRFRTYVDPSLVDYVVDHPDHVRFAGERRELTVGFSDLAGFTTLTDELGERVVPLLAEYMGHMVPVVRRRGYLAQQSGDGICFFFGAPQPDPDHARSAVATALAMHAALATFNGVLTARGDRPLGMRIGLATGEVIVGDAGPADASSYTAMGGTTNLAARLESANKFFGTATLVTARTVDLLGAQFLCRPIANLRVAGKLSCTVVHEPLCAATDATDRDRELARLTTAVFDAYRRGDFARCTAAAAALAAAFGPSKLAALYAERSADGHPDREGHCDGQIVMTEK